MSGRPPRHPPRQAKHALQSIPVSAQPIPVQAVVLPQALANSESIQDFREYLWKQFVLNTQIVDFPQMLDNARGLEAVFRQTRLNRLLTGIRNKRGGTEPTDRKKGRGVFSDEDIECKATGPAAGECFEQFKLNVANANLAFEENDLYLSIPSLDVLFWKYKNDDDYCDEGWQGLMEIYAADKEKSMSAKAEATGSREIFEPFEVILESLSKSLSYLTVPTQTWPHTFAGYDRFAQLAKALYRVAEVAKIEIRGVSRDTAYKLSRMLIGPCEFNMCQNKKFIPNKYQDTLHTFQRTAHDTFRIAFHEMFALFKEKLQKLDTRVKQPRPVNGKSSPTTRRNTDNDDIQMNMRSFSSAILRCLFRLNYLEPKLRHIIPEITQAKTILEKYTPLAQQVKDSICNGGRPSPRELPSVEKFVKSNSDRAGTEQSQERRNLKALARDGILRSNRRFTGS